MDFDPESIPPPLDADLASFFDVSLDLLCIRDMNLRFARVNRTWETVLGYPASELEGLELLPLIHPDDVEATRGHMDRMMRETEVHGFINRYRHRDGHYVHLEWRARRVGEKVFGAARDVTARLEAEARLAAAHEAAQAANQAKTEFLANMSHEIRTPLNGVLGVVSALSRTGLDPAQREMVDLIQQSGATLERMVSDLLDVSRIEAGRLSLQPHPFDLRRELEPVLDVSRRAAQAKGLAFEVKWGRGSKGRFGGDAVRIKQVLGNLLSNAVKFTDSGGVAVRLGVEPPARGAPVYRLSIAVEDSGIGFSPEAGAALFQRFSQADATITRRFGGAGLGLWICKALTDMMEGTLEARSEPGVGSVFSLALPLTAAGAQEWSGTRASPRLALSDRPLRVLLAEDHAVNRRVVELLLEPYGAELTAVENGVQALAAYAGGAFDLVLMDMQMPVMDGLAATRAIRAFEADRPERGRTPIAMLSANAMEMHQREARDAGADVHIAKPVTAQSFIDGINRALAAGL